MKFWSWLPLMAGSSKRTAIVAPPGYIEGRRDALMYMEKWCEARAFAWKNGFICADAETGLEEAAAECQRLAKLCEQ